MKFSVRRAFSGHALPPVVNPGIAMPDEWFKSSLSGLDGCVEARWTGAGIQLRDTKDPDSPILTFTDHEWHAFTGGVRRGEFDRR